MKFEEAVTIIKDRDDQVIRIQPCSHLSEDGPHVEIFINDMEIMQQEETGMSFIGLDFTLENIEKITEAFDKVRTFYKGVFK